MSKELLNQLLPLVTAIIVAVLTYSIKLIGTSIISYLNKKENLLQEKIGKAQFDKEIAIAKSVWNAVEENFRIKPILVDALGDKATAFDEALHKRLPYLQYPQIRALRQAIAGEINQGKTLLNINSFKQEVVSVQKENEQLKNEKIALQNKLNKFSEAVSKVDGLNEVNAIEPNPIQQPIKL